jgi:hypothetical protein
VGYSSHSTLIGALYHLSLLANIEFILGSKQ